jgi:hypothetical protein
MLNSKYIISGWLLATMNVGKVQPKSNVSHLIEEDEEARRPFVAADGDTGSSSSQEVLYTTSEPNGSVHYSKKYGAKD